MSKKRVERTIDREKIIDELYQLLIFPRYLRGVDQEDVELYTSRFQRTEVYQKQTRIFRTLMESITSLELEILLEVVKTGIFEKTKKILDETISRTSGELSAEGYQEIKKLMDKFKE